MRTSYPRRKAANPGGYLFPSERTIERQFAHAERNGVRAAYYYAEYLPERRRMMQAWADYLDSLREGGKVVPMFRANTQ